jgi:flagellar basal-body rod protein FlgF
MVKGLYRSASGMLVRQVRMDAISNNIANVNTTGFKRDNIFAKQLIDSMSIVDSSNGEHGSVADSLELYTNTSDGSYKATGHPLDAAIVGKGFFVVTTAEGQMLTRNGHFNPNNEGILSDSNGNPVEGDGGPISIPDGSIASINEHGEVVANGGVIGKLKIVDVVNEAQLEKLGNNYFNGNTIETTPQENSNLVSGSLENSNVDIMLAMIDMMSVQKEFETEQKMIQVSSDTLDRLIRDVGRGIG